MAIAATYHIACMLAIAATTAFLLTSLATHQWIQGCFSLAKMLDIVYEVYNQGVNSTDPSPGDAVRDHQMCVFQGLFSSTLNYNGFYTVQLPVDFFLLDTFVRVCVVFLGLAVAFAVVSVILLLLATASLNSTYEKKNRAIIQTRVSMLTVLAAFFMSLIGMSVYAGSTQKMIDDPIEYVTQVDKVLMSSFSTMEQDLAPMEEVFVVNTHRTRRDAPLITGIDLTELFQEMRPSYDFSFVFGWVGCLGFLVTVAMLFWTHRNMTYQPQPISEEKL